MIFKNIHSRCPELNINVKIDNKTIEQANTTEFLGILIDKKLNWHAHTTHVSNIISKCNGIIKKSVIFTTSFTFHPLQHVGLPISYVRSHASSGLTQIIPIGIRF